MNNIITPEGFLSIEELSKLPIHRILSYYKKKILTYHIDEWEWTDETTVVYNKYRDAVKHLMNSREHVEKK